MKRQAAGAPPRIGKTVRVKVTQRLRIPPEFSGDIVVTGAYKGTAVLSVVRDDGAEPRFHQLELFAGWLVGT